MSRVFQSCLLYVDCNLRSGIDRRRLDGLRRYAATRKWRVETLEHGDCSAEALREALARLRPIGCAAECWPPKTALRPAAFGRVPVVYFEPLDEPEWRRAHGVTCDNAAVGRLAFEELSLTHPPAYAVVSCGRGRRWANERTDSFLDCCRKAGAACDVAHFPFERADEFDDCVGRMVPWVAALPQRCAVFAVNDLYALAAAKAMSAAGRSFPRSLTLIGADGDDPPPWDRELAESISSVRLDFEVGGYRAAKMLGEMAENVHKSAMDNCSQIANGKSGALGERALPGTGGASRPGETVGAARRAARNLKSGSCGQVSQLTIARNSSLIPPLLVDRRKSTRGYGRREARILEAVEMIRREACDGLTAANLARRFPGTRQLFDLRFREAMGHSPLDEIIHVRLQRVLELLARPDFPISAIADFSGFPSERVLQKHFQSRFHTSMRDWRKARR